MTTNLSVVSMRQPGMSERTPVPPSVALPTRFDVHAVETFNEAIDLMYTSDEIKGILGPAYTGRQEF